MIVSSALFAAATEHAEAHHELPMPYWAYPAIAAVVFFVLFLLTYAFRNVSNKQQSQH
ncbi:hypothetical protein [Kineosporia babensis]|uniref:Uncharacterized protein n=1 Tax=Kineosporia babensis TaxID=499548 RepID=A0A9X1N8D9_9ACTN|nr:hypothetical protein [Kineosporia babensis]MCD5310382.1 hypothetical protein [Kineosporia babensis]